MKIDLVQEFPENNPPYTFKVTAQQSEPPVLSKLLKKYIY